MLIFANLNRERRAMARIELSWQEAVTGDPRRIIEDIKETKSRFHGVDVLFLDAQEFPVSNNLLQDHLIRKADRTGNPGLQALMGSLLNSLTLRLTQERTFSTVSPICFSSSRMIAHEAGPHDPLHPQTCIIILPEAHSYHTLMNPAYFLAKSFKHCAPLLDKRDTPAIAYMIAHHELAHGLGAAEEQADLISLLYTRKAFPDSIVPAVTADLRCIDTMLSAFRATRTHDQKQLNKVHTYSWGMTTANYYALSLPQHEVNSMSEREIVDTRFTRFEKHVDDVMDIAAIMNRRRGWFHDSPYAAGLLSRNFAEVADTACIFADDLSQRDINPLLKKMANAFANAADRLCRGRKAYTRGPVVNLQPVMP